MAATAPAPVAPTTPQIKYKVSAVDSDNALNTVRYVLQFTKADETTVGSNPPNLSARSAASLKPIMDYLKAATVEELVGKSFTLEDHAPSPAALQATLLKKAETAHPLPATHYDDAVNAWVAAIANLSIPAGDSPLDAYESAIEYDTQSRLLRIKPAFITLLAERVKATSSNSVEIWSFSELSKQAAKNDRQAEADGLDFAEPYQLAYNVYPEQTETEKNEEMEGFEDAAEEEQETTAENDFEADAEQLILVAVKDEILAAPMYLSVSGWRQAKLQPVHWLHSGLGSYYWLEQPSHMSFIRSSASVTSIQRLDAGNPAEWVVATAAPVPRRAPSVSVASVFPSVDLTSKLFSHGVTCCVALNATVPAVRAPTPLQPENEEAPAEGENVTAETAAEHVEENRPTTPKKGLLLAVVPYQGAGADNRNVYVFGDSNHGGVHLILAMHSQPILALISMGDLLLSGSADSTIAVWRAATAESVGVLQVNGAVSAMVAHPTNPAQFAVGDGYGRVGVWDVNTLSCIAMLAAHEMHVTSLCYSPSGEFLFSGAMDGHIRQWALHEKTLLPVAVIAQASNAQLAVRSIVTVDESVLLAGAADGAVRVYTSVTQPGEKEITKKQEPVRVLKVHHGAVRALSVLSESRQVVTGGHDGLVRVHTFAPKDNAAQQRAERERDRKLDPYEYLAEKVYPALNLSLAALDRERPSDPATFIALHLLEYDRLLRSYLTPKKRAAEEE